ncbi:STAS domain-containing protein [Tomitella gaofuii]|uniref:STAS domain-containing protein n=1 Tax=Tomitella gaofuii TaxID=2760083 RepID=UPI0015FA9707|nr:STAS domain-containing protein [Tomitella gaofuii]
MSSRTQILPHHAPAGGDNLDAALGQITSAAVAAIPAAAHAGITCPAKPGHVSSHGATDPAVDTLALSQNARRRGPWLPTARRLRTITIVDTAADRRWPEFAFAARQSGFGSILAVGLSADDPTLGTLTLYATDVDAFDGDDETIAAVFAGHAATLLRSHTGGEGVAAAAPAAGAHAIIAHAEGVLMDMHHVNAGEARVMLRRAAHQANLTTADAAYWLITDAATTSRGRNARARRRTRQAAADDASRRPAADTGGDPVIVEVRGDIDAATAPALAARLARLPVRDTVADMTGVGFCSARGLELLVEHSRRLADSGAVLRLAGCPPALRAVIDRLGLDDALPTANTTTNSTGPGAPDTPATAPRRVLRERRVDGGARTGGVAAPGM